MLGCVAQPFFSEITEIFMGAIHFSLDPTLARLFRDELEIEIFVETGTFQGDTAFAMASVFPRVITIELSTELAEKASERFAMQPEVRVVQGSSASVLKDLHCELSGATVLYWLDAHWCSADATAGFESQCPLLEELASLGKLQINGAILIDDARLFLAAPAAPHEISNWPTFDEVLRRIREVAPAHEISVLNDVIVVIPPKMRLNIQEFARTHGHDLLRIASDARDKGKLAEDRFGYISSLEAEREEHAKGIAALRERTSRSEAKAVTLNTDLQKIQATLGVRLESAVRNRLNNLKGRLRTLFPDE